MPPVTFDLFVLASGSLQKNLMMFYHKAAGFSARFPVDVHRGQDAFNGAVLDWHAAFTNLVVSAKNVKQIPIHVTSWWKIVHQLFVILENCFGVDLSFRPCG